MHFYWFILAIVLISEYFPPHLSIHEWLFNCVTSAVASTHFISAWNNNFIPKGSPGFSDILGYFDVFSCCCCLFMFTLESQCPRTVNIVNNNVWH